MYECFDCLHTRRQVKVLVCDCFESFHTRRPVKPWCVTILSVYIRVVSSGKSSLNLFFDLCFVCRYTGRMPVRVTILSVFIQEYKCSLCLDVTVGFECLSTGRQVYSFI